MPDPIARDDEAFDVQATQHHDWVTIPANAAAASLGSPDTDPIAQKFPLWQAKYESYKEWVQAGETIVADKNFARREYETPMRANFALMRVRHKNGTLTDGQVTAAGLPLLDTTPTTHAIPSTRPVLTIERSDKLAHTVAWRDESTPGSRVRPAGADFMQLCVAVVAQGAPAPANPAAFTYYKVPDPKSPNVVTYEPADGGKKAYILGRWGNDRGEWGPWSEVIDDTIRS